MAASPTCTSTSSGSHAATFAIKVMRQTVDDGASASHFVEEANLMASVSTHPNIVSIFAADVAPDGRPYLVMEYFVDGNLGDRSRSAPLPVREVLEIGVKIASAVETARPGRHHPPRHQASQRARERVRPGIDRLRRLDPGFRRRAGPSVGPFDGLRRARDRQQARVVAPCRPTCTHSARRCTPSWRGTRRHRAWNRANVADRAGRQGVERPGTSAHCARGCRGPWCACSRMASRDAAGHATCVSTERRLGAAADPRPKVATS